jgi:L-lysine 6-transaminase
MAADVAADLRRERRLIFDEVQAGMGLTERWCCEHFELSLTLVFGKAQVRGVMAGPRLDEVKDNVFLPGSSPTWGGNFTDYVRSTHFESLRVRNWWRTRG